MEGFLLLACARALASEAGDATQAALVPPEPVVPLVPAWPIGVPGPEDGGPVVVVLDLVIGEDGEVDAVTLVSGEPPFSEYALVFAQGLRFTPATEGGEPVAVEVPLELVYTPPPPSLSGVVVDDDGEPVPGAIVAVGGASTVTDAAGAFRFPALPAGSATVTVTHPDHAFPDASVDLADDATVTVRLVAAPPPPAEQGIVGTYQRGRAEVVRRTLSVDDLRATPGTMGDPLRALSNLPGAVRTPLDAGWILVRGGYPDDTAVYLDGVRVPLVYHLGGFTSVLHPAFIDAVALYPGGQSARYGRAIAGAVDVTLAPAPDHAEVSLGANLIHAGGYVAVPFTGGAIEAGARRSYLDAVLGLVPGVGETASALAPRFYDAEARLTLGPTRTTFLGALDTLNASDTSGNALTVDLSTQRVHSAWGADVGARRLELRPYAARDTRHLDIAALDLQADTTVLAAGLRVETPDSGLDEIGWSAGVDAGVQQVRLDVNGIGRAVFIGSPEPYADLRIGTGPTLVLGLRADTWLVEGQLPRVGASPRMSFRWPISDHLTVTADGGGFHQPPPASLVAGPPVGATLPLAWAWGGGLGAQGTVGPIDLDLSGWGRRSGDITGYEVDGSVGPVEALAYGVDGQARAHYGPLHGWVTAGWSRSLRREERGLPWEPAVYDQPLSVVLVGMVDPGKGWTLSSRFRYASGFPLPPTRNPVVYDALTQTSVGLVGDVHGRLPAYHAVDLKVSRRTDTRHWIVEGYLDVENVYNRRVPEPVITGFPELTSEWVYGYGLTVLPIFGVEVTWKGATPGTRAP